MCSGISGYEDTGTRSAKDLGDFSTLPFPPVIDETGEESFERTKGTLSMQPEVNQYYSQHSKPDLTLTHPGKELGETEVLCSCIGCLQVGFYTSDDFLFLNFLCRVSGCQWSIPTGDMGSKAHRTHERKHYDRGERFICTGNHCRFVTKRWADLIRHCTSRHCLNPRKLPCHVLGCMYGGGRGFTREDKLRSHYKNVHPDVNLSSKGF